MYCWPSLQISSMQMVWQLGFKYSLRTACNLFNSKHFDPLGLWAPSTAKQSNPQLNFTLWPGPGNTLHVQAEPVGKGVPLGQSHDMQTMSRQGQMKKTSPLTEGRKEGRSWEGNFQLPYKHIYFRALTEEKHPLYRGQQTALGSSPSLQEDLMYFSTGAKYNPLMFQISTPVPISWPSLLLFVELCV